MRILNYDDNIYLILNAHRRTSIQMSLKKRRTGNNEWERNIRTESNRKNKQIKNLLPVER